jgi:Kef-type K+ transport system membrane component KefB
MLVLGHYPATEVPLGDGGLGLLPTVNVATVTVAFVAGIVGILAFETRSSAAVGVAISITTIPAAAYIGAALAMHDGPDGGGAVAVLAVNVVVLVAAGTMTLFGQRLLQRRARSKPVIA